MLKKLFFFSGGCILALGAAELPVPVMCENFDGKSSGVSSQIEYQKGKEGRAAHFSVKRHSYIKFDGKKINGDEGTISIWFKPDLPLKRGNLRTILNIGGPAKELQGVNFAIDNNALCVPYMRIENINLRENAWNHVAYTWKLNKEDKNFPFRFYAKTPRRCRKATFSYPLP